MSGSPIPRPTGGHLDAQRGRHLKAPPPLLWLVRGDYEGKVPLVRPVPGIAIMLMSSAAWLPDAGGFAQ